jgi:cell division protease FtsH
MRNTLIFIAILLAAIAIFWSLSQNMHPQPAEVSISDVIAMSQQNQIKTIDVDGDKLTITKADGTQVISYKEPNANLSDYKNVGLNLTGVNVDVKNNSGINWGTILINFLPLLLIG